MSDPPRPPGPEASLLQTLERARMDAARLAEDLRAELAAIGESTEATPDDEHDAEGSTVGYERARVTGLLDRSERTIADIDAAVARVEAGTYGTCEACGSTIPAERLAALPTTARCAACATGGPGIVQRHWPTGTPRWSPGLRRRPGGPGSNAGDAAAR